MTLTLKQQYEVLHAVSFCGGNLDNYVQALNGLIALRQAHGPDVETYLAGVITAQQVLDARAAAIQQRDWIRAQVQTLLGDGLDALERT